MQALADRLSAAGLPARVFGHPARLPGDGNVLIAAGGALIAALAGLVMPEVGRIASLAAVALCAALFFGLSLWPKVAAWTVIVGSPGTATRTLRVLALDHRVPHRWLFVSAAAASTIGTLLPGSSTSMVAALAALLSCGVERGRPRELSLEAAMAWVQQRPPTADSVTLVSTAASGFGEGVACVVGWHQIDRARLRVEVDEQVSTGVVERLRAAGIGAKPAEGPDVVAIDHVRG